MKRAPWLVAGRRRGRVPGRPRAAPAGPHPALASSGPEPGSPPATRPGPAARTRPGPPGRRRSRRATGAVERTATANWPPGSTISGGRITAVRVPVLRTAEQYSQQLADQVHPDAAQRGAGGPVAPGSTRCPGPRTPARPTRSRSRPRWTRRTSGETGSDRRLRLTARRPPHRSAWRDRWLGDPRGARMGTVVSFAVAARPARPAGPRSGPPARVLHEARRGVQHLGPGQPAEPAAPRRARSSRPGRRSWPRCGPPASAARDGVRTAGSTRGPCPAGTTRPGWSRAGPWTGRWTPLRPGGPARRAGQRRRGPGGVRWCPAPAESWRAGIRHPWRAGRRWPRCSRCTARWRPPGATSAARTWWTRAPASRPAGPPRPRSPGPSLALADALATALAVGGDAALAAIAGLPGLRRRT